jgi:hypothetical protein
VGKVAEADEAPASAATAADGTSEARAAVVDSGSDVVATSGTVDGSDTGASGVRFHGVQDRLRDETEANGDAAMGLEYTIGRFPRAMLDGCTISTRLDRLHSNLHLIGKTIDSWQEKRVGDWISAPDQTK